MNELSLFSGAGGGLLGSILLGWRTVGYVEINKYCQKVIAQRIRDGIFPEAPIFSDIRAFIDQGYAREYQGMVDIISAGFPCQPFSVAGKRRGEMDERNMWPAIVRVIREVQPQFCLLENVSGLSATEYFGTVLQDLAKSGYNARWKVVSAGELGAPHRRDRLWIVANRRRGSANAVQSKRFPRRNQETNIGNDREDVAYSHQKGLQERPQSKDGRADLRQEGETPAQSGWWSVEPRLGRVANGVANRVDKLKTLGNGQVPIVVATVWRLLTNV